MKIISLKKPAQKETKGMAMEPPKDSYPQFSIYDNAPEELMKCSMGKELLAKVKMTSKDMHEGPNARKGVGFDVMSITMDDTDDRVEEARKKGKKIADDMKAEKMKKMGM